MRHLGLFLMGSLALAACASNNTPPAASSSTVAQATTEPSRGPDFSPASSDGLATAPAETRSAAKPTQPSPTLAATTRADSSATNSTGDRSWNQGNEGAAAVAATTGNAAAAPSDRTNTPNSDADNSRVNKRDRSSAALTPMDQGPSEADRKITQQIRQDLMKDKSLSFTAKNVKIITIGGKVTLRGPVKSDAERAAIEAAARRAVGSGAQVDSQIEISK